MGLSAIAAFLVLVRLAFGSTAPDGDWLGDYAGWGYEIAETDGGDMPLRLHLRAPESPESHPRVFIDSPAARAIQLPAQNIRTDGPRIDFERVDSNGRIWRFALTRDGEDLLGRLTIESIATFGVHLRKSERALAVAPEEHGGVEGCYRVSGGGLIWIWPRPWGELQYFDSRSSRQGTLFRGADGSLFAGESEYLPSGISADVAFERDANARATGLIWKNSGQAALRAERVELESHEIEARSGDAVIRGTLTFPPGDGQRPVAIVVGGSSWSVRNDCIQDSRLLLSMGLGVLTYDRRGCGRSTGSELCTFEESAADVNAIVRAVRARPDVRNDAVGLVGRSRGGWTAPLAASRGDPSFVIMISGAAVSPLRTQESHRLHRLRSAGFGDEAIRSGKRYLDLLWAADQSDDAWAAYAVERERILQKGWWRYLAGPDSRDSGVFRWQSLNYRYEPSEALASLRCPLLSIYGELDDNISPSDNVPALREATRDSRHASVTIAVLKNADHGLRLYSEPLSLRNELHRSSGWVPEFATTIRAWLKKQGIIESAETRRAE